jgi:hypothetical protein
MRPTYLWTALLLAWAGPALANGGGYSFGVTFTGSVAPFQASGTENVRILDERLDVTLRRTDATVVVRYAMRNVTDQPATVKFGFPVEADPGGDGEEGFLDIESLTQTERRQMLAGAIQQLKGYGVTADGVPVRSEFQLEQFSTGKAKPFPGSKQLEGIAGWMVSEVTFPASATVAVEIRYSADHSGSSTFVSDDSRESARTFAYRLSTGAVWNGTIAKGTVTVVADGIPPDEVEIAAPRERFRREGDKWVWSFTELEPTLADDLRIVAVPGYQELFGYGEGLHENGVLRYLQRRGEWGAGHRRFHAKASSVLPRNKAHDFGPEHLADESYGAPWAEGAAGNGVGEWVELAPVKPAPLLALSIFPGFGTPGGERRLFEANGSPTRVEIVLNGERSFTATLGDSPRGQLIPILAYAKPVSRIRITIRDVRPGKKYEDTCIAKVTLYDRLAKAPPVHGAR